MSAAARDWIVRLPAGTPFRTGAVPGPRHVDHNVLVRLSAAEQPIIGRAARGVYWRQPPLASHSYGRPPLRFEERSNLRRRSLNWNEANLLEAAKCARKADYHNWEHAMWLLTEASGWMKRGEQISLDEAIRLAVSLDPGPRAPRRLAPPGPLVAYPAAVSREMFASGGLR
ncbi:MAG: hypothetical protein OXF65_11780 [Acidimicrobiaceae bacterium]|nr:hypothetical protein [Acidimicrobiaceae bacterium]